MKIGFHYHIPAISRDGVMYTAGYLGLFLDGLAQHCERLVLFLHTPRADEMPQMDYALQSENIRLVSLMEHLSIPRRLIKGRSCARKVAIAVREEGLDLLLLRAPTPILPFLVEATRGSCLHALLVVGDLRDHVTQLNQPWWRAPLVRRYIFWNENRQEQLAHGMLVFTNSAVFYERYKTIAERAVLVRTTTLRQADFYPLEPKNDRFPFRLLYAGRIETGKGLLLIAEAVIALCREGLNLHWDIVGWSEPGDETAGTIQKMFGAAGMETRVEFHGKKKAGPELFAYYRRADAYVMASLLSEGFPRTIWEAMAHGAPVIATPVGSISHYLRHRENSLLVQADAADIAKNIRLLFEDNALRERLAVAGRETAAESTIEFQSQKMALEIKNYLASHA